MMRWLTRIQDKLHGITPEQRAMIDIRQLLSGFGVDVSRLTDDEIKDRIGRFSDGMAKTGVTFDELDRALRRVGQHTEGLDKVPFDGYIAQLHEPEVHVLCELCGESMLVPPPLHRGEKYIHRHCSDSLELSD